MVREVSNLGLDASNRYAKDQEILDKTLLQEARTIPSQTEVDVTRPSYKSEFELLFALGEQRITRATFTPPERFDQGSRSLFAFNISNKIGGPQRQEVKIEKLTAYSAKGDKQKEKETLLKSLNIFLDLEKQKIDIYSRRGQYHKG